MKLIVPFQLVYSGIQTPDVRIQEYLLCAVSYINLTFLHGLAIFGNWSSRGCNLVGMEKGEIVCRCDHLSHFGMLMVRT